MTTRLFRGRPRLAVLALGLNIVLSFYLGYTLLGRSGQDQTEGPELDDENDEEGKSYHRLRHSQHESPRKPQRRSRRIGDEDAHFDWATLARLSSSMSITHSRPNLHLRCTPPESAVHVAIPAAPTEFAGAAAAAFSALRNSGSPENVYLHFIIPAGADSSGVCSRMRLYARTYPEVFCHGKRGGLRQSFHDSAVPHRATEGDIRVHAGSQPNPSSLGHAANESVAWGLHHTWTRPPSVPRHSGKEVPKSAKSSATHGGRRLLQNKRIVGIRHSDVKAEAMSHIKMARLSHLMPEPKLWRPDGHSVSGLEAQKRERGSEDTGKRKYSLSPAEGHSLEEPSRPGGKPVDVPECSGKTDSRARKRQLDHQAETDEWQRRFQALEEKLAECRVVPGLANYTFRNATDCARPEDVSGLVPRVRLVGFEKEDALDRLFQASSPCGCGLAQVDVLHFNLSHWATPGDVMDNLKRVGNDKALLSFAKIFLDDLLLPWNVNATVVLEPDTLLVGDINALWGSSPVTMRPWKSHAAGSGRGEDGGQVVLEGFGKVTEVHDPQAVQTGPPPQVLAVAGDCEAVHKKEYNTNSFTVSRLLRPSDCLARSGVFLLDIEAYAAHRLQVKVVDLLLRHKSGERLWVEDTGHADKAFFLGLGQSQAKSLNSAWNLGELGRNPDVKGAAFKAGKLLHWSGPRKPWLTNGLYQGRWVRYYLHWSPARAAPPSRRVEMPPEQAQDEEHPSGWWQWLLHMVGLSE